jgi:hypothetical protein
MQNCGKLLTLKEIFTWTRVRHGDADRRQRPDDSRTPSTERRKGPHDRRKGLCRLGFGLLCLGVAAPASAQIYSWRDLNGNLVVSNRPKGGGPNSYVVPKTESIRATRPVAADRGVVYDDIISEHSRRHGVRTDLVRAVVQVESGFNPYARSPKGALGLMQLMPSTIQRFAVRNPFNPVENVSAGVAYLRQLLDRYQDNETLALAAYNAGPGAVDRHGQRVPPYRETRNYVQRINQMTAPPVRDKRIYKTTEVVDGRSVPRYSDHKPPSGGFAVVSR